MTNKHWYEEPWYIIGVTGIGLALTYLSYKIMTIDRATLLFRISNQSLPPSGQNILQNDIRPTKEPSFFNIQMSATVNGIFSAVVINPFGTYFYIFNNGIEIPANAGQNFYLQVYSDELVNFRFSGTGGSINMSITEDSEL